MLYTGVKYVPTLLRQKLFGKVCNWQQNIYLLHHHPPRVLNVPTLLDQKKVATPWILNSHALLPSTYPPRKSVAEIRGKNWTFIISLLGKNWNISYHICTQIWFIPMLFILRSIRNPTFGVVVVATAKFPIIVSLRVKTFYVSNIVLEDHVLPFSHVALSQLCVFHVGSRSKIFTQHFALQTNVCKCLLIPIIKKVD